MASERRAFSARWSSQLLERLGQRSTATRINKSRLAERYVDEGIRADEHPGVVFRGGPSGRRAALAAGPDVWEVVSVLKDGETRGESAVGAAAERLNLTDSQVRIAARYYGAYPDEVDDRIRRNIEEADAAEAAWRREQAALA